MLMRKALLLALLIVRNVRGRTSSRRFAAMFAALLLVLLGTSFELFLDTAFLTALGFGLALLHPSGRKVVLMTGWHVALAYGVCLPVLAPLAVLALSASHGPLQYAPSDYSIDLLNVVVGQDLGDCWTTVLFVIRLRGSRRSSGPGGEARLSGGRDGGYARLGVRPSGRPTRLAWRRARLSATERSASAAGESGW